MSIQENPRAWELLPEVASAYAGVTVEDIMAPLETNGHHRPPMVTAARRSAITVLANETIDGIPRFPIAQIAKWFGVSRVAIYKQRARHDAYRRRQAAEEAPKPKGRRRA